MKKPSRAFVAVFASLLITGAGQLIAGRRLRGLLLFGNVLVVLGIAAGTLLYTGKSLFELLLQPRVLLSLLAINAIVLMLRLIAVIDAYQVARVPGAVRRVRFRAVSYIGIGLVLLITVVPHLAIGYYNVVAYTLLTTVFVENNQHVVSTTAASTPPMITIASTATPAITSRPTPTGLLQATSAPPQVVSEPSFKPVPMPSDVFEPVVAPIR